MPEKEAKTKKIPPKVNIDKEKIEKQIIKDIKTELKPELKNELKPELKEEVMEDLLLVIDRETKNKLDKVEHKINHHKNMSILRKTIIIIILLLLVIFETKLLYDHNLIPYIQNNNIEKTPEDNTTIEVYNNDTSNTILKDKEWYLDNYSYLLDNVKTNLTDDNKYYLYEGNYKELTIKNSVRLNMAYQVLEESNIQTENNVITISNENLKEAYKKVFGSIANYKESNFSNDCIQFFYDSINDNYMAINTICEESNTEFKEYIDNIYEEDNNIIIETIIGVYNKDNNTLLKINGTEVSDSFNEEFSIEDYKELLDKYKYTFKNIDGEYYFNSIEKVLTID